MPILNPKKNIQAPHLRFISDNTTTIPGFKNWRMEKRLKGIFDKWESKM